MPHSQDALNEKQLAVIEAVRKINNEMYDKVGWENHQNLLSVAVASYHFSIDFDVNLSNGYIKIPIYSSVEDDRIYYEKSDKYEEWYSYIKRKFRNIKNELNKIKL